MGITRTLTTSETAKNARPFLLDISVRADVGKLELEWVVRYTTGNKSPDLLTSEGQAFIDDITQPLASWSERVVIHSIEPDDVGIVAKFRTGPYAIHYGEFIEGGTAQAMRAMVTLFHFISITPLGEFIEKQAA